MYFTRDGLEQATRPAIADHHARRFVAAGVRRVIDLGCGIGSDALAFARAGLEVVAVERDPDTAAVAAANLAGRATVVCADAEQVAGDLLADGSAVYADPARRTERGRVWRLAEVTPPWSFVTRLLDGRRPAGVKLAPALPHAEIPATAEAEWLSHGGAVVEAGLWAGPGAAPGVRAAVVWPADDSPPQRVAATAEAPLPVRDLGDYLYEPDGAVIRSGAIADVGLLAGCRPARPPCRVPDRGPAADHAVRHRVRRARPTSLSPQGVAPLAGRARDRSPGDQAARPRFRSGRAAPRAPAGRTEARRP